MRLPKRSILFSYNNCLILEIDRLCMCSSIPFLNFTVDAIFLSTIGTVFHNFTPKLENAFFPLWLLICNFLKSPRILLLVLCSWLIQWSQCSVLPKLVQYFTICNKQKHDLNKIRCNVYHFNSISVSVVKCPFC